MRPALAIPVHNDADELVTLLRRAHALDCFGEMVVVDDGSTLPLNAARLTAEAGLETDQLRLIRHQLPQGPGAARNRALAEVQSDPVMFMDADDLPTRELPGLFADLASRDFDFCLFQHHDTRSEDELRWGQMPWDQRFWRQAGVDLGALSEVGAEAGPLLAQTANYPWNKVYRTAFLRTHQIGCTDILVHEDVELHWRAFLKAKTIFASDRIGVIHTVASGGDRLTNRAGPERLAAFGPLTAISAEIAQSGPDSYSLAFARFALGLIAWIGDNIDPAHHPALAEKTKEFLYQSLGDGTYKDAIGEDQGLLRRIQSLIGHVA